MKTLNFKINEIVIALTISAIVFLCGCGQMSVIIRDDTAGINGSFEVTKSGLPVNWLLFTPKTIENSDFNIILYSTEHKDGKLSLKF